MTQALSMNWLRKLLNVRIGDLGNDLAELVESHGLPRV